MVPNRTYSEAIQILLLAIIELLLEEVVNQRKQISIVEDDVARSTGSDSRQELKAVVSTSAAEHRQSPSLRMRQ
jgi:hypothetical protein